MVATSLSNLALLHVDLEQYSDAETLYEQALRIRKKALGPAHPEVATSLENYADLLGMLGRDEEAKELKARAMTIRSKHVDENLAK